MVIRGNTNNRQLIGMIAIFLLIISGLILSVSMSGLLAVLMSLAVWLFLAKSTLKNITLVSVVLILIFVIVNFQSKYLYLSIATRMRDISIDGIHITTLISRIETYSAAWDSIIKNPLVGVGIGSTSGVTETGQMVHNILLSSWFEAGLFGFLGMLMILFSSFSDWYQLDTVFKLKPITSYSNLSLCILHSISDFRNVTARLL